MLTTDSMPNALRTLTPDGRLLCLTRFVRLFAYGSLSVVLVFYLIGLGLSESQTGLLLTLTLVAVIQQTDADHYQALAKIPTTVGARTGLWYEKRDRFYLAVPASSKEGAALWVYAPDG